MPECHVGHQPIVGCTFTTNVGGEKVPMCPVHGRTFQYGNAMIVALGRDHPLVVDLIRALAPVMDSTCPEVGGGTPSQEPCAQGTQTPLRGGSGTRGAGVPQGTGVG